MLFLNAHQYSLGLRCPNSYFFGSKFEILFFVSKATGVDDGVVGAVVGSVVVGGVVGSGSLTRYGEKRNKMIKITAKDILS